MIHLLQELEVAVRVAGFTLGGRAEHGGDVRVTLMPARVTELRSLIRARVEATCTSACAAK